VTYLVTGRQIKSVERLAREDRQQSLLVDAYVIVTANIFASRAHIDWRLKFMEDGEVVPEPTGPAHGPDELAVASLMVSDAASPLMIELGTANMRFDQLSRDFRTSPLPEIAAAAKTASNDILVKAWAVRKQIRAELNSGT
jgi:hypothetical protein